MPNRSSHPTSGDESRIGMDGQERDLELGNNLFSAEFWEYDARIGKRWNIDPITYPWQSPYACFNNNPVYFSDPSGEEGGPPDVKGHKVGDVYDEISKGADGKEYSSRWYVTKAENGDLYWQGAGMGYNLDQISIISKTPSHRLRPKEKNWCAILRKAENNPDFFGAGVDKGKAYFYAVRSSFDTKNDFKYFRTGGHWNVLSGEAYINDREKLGSLCDAGARAAVTDGDIYMRFGKSDMNFTNAMNGSVLGANANFQTKVLSGENGLYGGRIDANAGANVAKAEWKPSLSLMGFKVKGTVGLSFMTAQAGITIGVYYDKHSQSLILEGIENLGILGGQKMGMTVELPLPRK